MKRLLALLLLLPSLFTLVGCEDVEYGSDEFGRAYEDLGDLRDEPLFENIVDGREFSRNLQGYLNPPNDGCDYYTNPSSIEDHGIHPDLLDNFKKLGGDPVAYQQTMCFLREHGQKKFDTSGAGYPNGIGIESQRYVTINDLNMPSSQKRLFILDTVTGEVQAYHSAHGAGKGNRSNSPEVAEHFSNDHGSHLTPSGFMVTGNRYTSQKEWRYGMRLHGIQRGVNDNTLARGVVLHQFAADSGMASSNELSPDLTGQTAHRTWGCTGVASEHWQDIMNRLQSGVEGRTSPYRGGSLYYNYSPREKNLGRNYCGDALMEK